MKMENEGVQAELNVELGAAADYLEKHGVDFYSLSPTTQRKIIENWKEDHE